MNDISFACLKNNDDIGVLNELFDILYQNMNVIAPTGEGYETDKKCWLASIASALKNTNRHIILIRDNTKLIGFFMYSISSNIFIMEEIQFVSEYQGVGVFQKLYQYIFNWIPHNVEFVEAYANKKNTKSQGILTHLGMQCIGENQNGRSFHYRGLYRDLKEALLSNHCSHKVECFD